MVLPFLHLFAYEVKEANQYTLSLMTVAMVIARIFFGVPCGRLADRLGRKKAIYMLTPLWYLSVVALLLARGPALLVLAGALWGFYPIMAVVTSSMSLELVPVQRMGRWTGVRGLVAGLVAVPAPLVSGLLWRHVGPNSVFVVPVVLDLALRVPLLATVPETLWKESR
jgi:MFS family permease